MPQDHPEDLLKHRFLREHLGRDPRICISNKFPDAAAAGPGTTLRARLDDGERQPHSGGGCPLASHLMV